MHIHREGHRLLLSLFVLFTALNLGVVYFFPDSGIAQGICIFVSAIMYLLVLQFFRNPHRSTPLNPLHIISPADGKIVAIEEIDEPEYYKDKRVQISVFMSPLNVHVNRHAITGEVKYTRYHSGLYLIASHPKSSTENERSTVVVESKSGDSVLMRQIAGYVARRIRTYCKPGDKALQGGEFGFIKFGSRVDVIVPLNAHVKVKMGEIVKGGLTTLAIFEK
jgi:phosphatidylserine decarboxylase